MIHELKGLYLRYKEETNQERKNMIVDEYISLCKANPWFADPGGEDIIYIIDFFQPKVLERLNVKERLMKKRLNRNGTVLLINEEEFEDMKNYFIENNYTSPHPREMGSDVRFAEFASAKDIILKNESFNLMVFNDYERQESTLITFTEIDTFYEKDRREYTFNSVDDFYSKLSFYKKDLSKENGTIQVIDWILN